MLEPLSEPALDQSQAAKSVFWLRAAGVSLPGLVVSDRSAASIARVLLNGMHELKTVEVLREGPDAHYWRRVQTRSEFGAWYILRGRAAQLAAQDLIELRQMSAASSGPAAKERRAREVEAMRAEFGADAASKGALSDQIADEQHLSEGFRSWMVDQETKKRRG